MISRSIKDTSSIAAEFARGLEPRLNDREEGVLATVIALHGDLGSGKTTFTKAFAAALGIPEEEVTSPTFVIEKRFDIHGSAFFKRLIHIDAYRLERPEEIERLGWKQTLADKANLVLVEWPENIGSAMPQNVPTISFTFIDENTREIVFN
ncbi:MAG: tRNA (adenosine(37)-N6)-threonylcarbamoyltransferase complex ATPase subunit type 1 TsaE [Candidatus Paceibacterota bacterium]|jgi:tRNA threonylcarbamoyladenosine biosynthesis protein TsaE